MVTSAVTGGRGGPSSSRAVYSLTGDTLTLETSNSLPDGSMSQVRTATYVKYTPVPMPAPPSRTVESGYVEPVQRQGPDRLEGERESRFVQGRERRHRRQRRRPGRRTCSTTGRSAIMRSTNFDLRLDVLARYRSNGGVYVMTEFQPQGFPGKGFEIQVNNSHSDRIRTGSLYHVVDLSNVPGKDDEWIPMEIKGAGNTITITLKGEEVVRWTQPADWQSNYDTASRKIGPGTIAFQSHDTYSVTAYSNIRVKLLN